MQSKPQNSGFWSYSNNPYFSRGPGVKKTSWEKQVSCTIQGARAASLQIVCFFKGDAIEMVLGKQSEKTIPPLLLDPNEESFLYRLLTTKEHLEKSNQDYKKDECAIVQAWELLIVLKALDITTDLTEASRKALWKNFPKFKCLYYKGQVLLDVEKEGYIINILFHEYLKDQKALHSGMTSFSVTLDNLIAFAQMRTDPLGPAFIGIVSRMAETLADVNFDILIPPPPVKQKEENASQRMEEEKVEKKENEEEKEEEDGESLFERRNVVKYHLELDIHTECETLEKVLNIYGFQPIPVPKCPVCQSELAKELMKFCPHSSIQVDGFYLMVTDTAGQSHEFILM